MRRKYISKFWWIRPLQAICYWFGANRAGSMIGSPNTFRYTMETKGWAIKRQRMICVGKVFCKINNFFEKLTW